MRILMIHPHDLNSPMEPWTIRIKKFADELADRGHEVTVGYFPITQSEQSVFRGIRIVPLDRRISCGGFIKNAAAIYKLACQADIIHFQKAHFYAVIPVLLAALFSGKPLHYDWDDWEERIFDLAIRNKTPSSLLIGFSFYVMENCLPFLADSVSVSSEALRKLSIKRGAKGKNVVVAPVGADLKRFYPGRSGAAVRRKHDLTDEIVAFYHGQLHSCQYVRMFLQAAKIIVQKNTGIPLKVMIVGSGSDLGPLESFSRELGLDQMVIFTGFIPHDDIPDYIAAADICVAPFEDNEVTRCKSPLKIAEYMAAGKPVVASHVGEVGHMLGGAGLLIAPRSPEQLAEGILRLANNPELRGKMSVAARKGAEERYNWRCSVKNLEAVYMNIL